MSPPNKISFSAPPGGNYDEGRGICVSAEPPHPQGPRTAPFAGERGNIDRSPQAMARLYAEVFGSAPQARVNRGIWAQSPFQFSGWSLIATIPGCGGGESPFKPINGDDIPSVEAVGSESNLNTQAIGNVDGIGLASAEGNVSAVAWSAFDSSAPANTGTFAFLRTGESGGSQSTVSSDTSSRHLGTTAAVLSNGDTVVVYARVSGDEPTTLVAQRISRTGTAVGEEIEILPSSVRTQAPLGQVIALQDGFLVVSREQVDSNGQIQTRMGVRRYDANGTLQSSEEDIGASGSSSFAIAASAEDLWALAEISGSNQIRVRTFRGTTVTGNAATISGATIPNDPDIALAMQQDGRMMVAWNAVESSDQRIDGAYLGANANVEDGPFVLRRSTLAHTLALASDHRGNYGFAWEEGGLINAYLYNGTRNPATPGAFSSISSGDQNSNVLLTISPEGTLSLVYDKASSEAGQTLHNIARRDFRLVYK